MLLNYHGSPRPVVVLPEEVTLDNLTAEDTAILNQLKGHGVEFMEGASIFLPSGRKIDGSEMTKLLREFEAR